MQTPPPMGAFNRRLTFPTQDISGKEHFESFRMLFV